MVLSNLRSLHQSMVALGAIHQQFRYNVRQASFDCLFSTGEYPFLLCLTSRGANPLFLKVTVHDDFRALAWLPEHDFWLLVNLLKTDGTSSNKLTPSNFFAELDAATPTVARHNAVPTNPELIRLRPDITEHRDRPYFDTWIYWKVEERGPSEENRAKTLAMLGRDALEHSARFRASSKWSAQETPRSWQTEAAARTRRNSPQQ